MLIYQVIGILEEKYTLPMYDKIFYKYYSALDYFNELLVKAEIPQLVSKPMYDYIERAGNGWCFILEAKWVNMD